MQVDLPDDVSAGLSRLVDAEEYEDERTALIELVRFALQARAAGTSPPPGGRVPPGRPAGLGPSPPKVPPRGR